MCLNREYVNHVNHVDPSLSNKWLNRGNVGHVDLSGTLGGEGGTSKK